VWVSDRRGGLLGTVVISRRLLGLSWLVGRLRRLAKGVARAVSRPRRRWRWQRLVLLLGSTLWLRWMLMIVLMFGQLGIRSVLLLVRQGGGFRRAWRNGRLM
jgi:hypothetical protein